MLSQPPIARLASLPEMRSERFRLFMEDLNAFAAPLGLQQHTASSKAWEYPWLWFNCLGSLPEGAALLDIGSELSPMPWYLAHRFRMRIVLIEVHDRLHGHWAWIREQLKLEASWHVVQSAEIPLPDASCDFATSFSVIEHQPDKAAAVAEVVRILRPQGVLALSFDICEPELGMSFPAWNGAALSKHSFETVLWRHPAFASAGAPLAWNNDAIEPFLEWHRGTATHHNYVAGAAVLPKRALGQG